MTRKLHDSQVEDEKSGPSREDIETICVMYTIGRSGCESTDLAATLGFSTALASAVGTCLTPIVGKGWVEIDDGRVSLTDAGTAWLKQELARWLPHQSF